MLFIRLYQPYRMYVPMGLSRVRPFPVFSPHKQSSTISTPSGDILQEKRNIINHIAALGTGSLLKSGPMKIWNINNALKLNIFQCLS